MKAVSIDDDSVVEFVQVRKLLKAFNADKLAFSKEDLPSDSDVIYVYLCPFASDVRGESVLKFALTAEVAGYDRHEAAMDI